MRLMIIHVICVAQGSEMIGQSPKVREDFKGDQEDKETMQGSRSEAVKRDVTTGCMQNFRPPSQPWIKGITC
jgi:hypothetical protein